MSAVLSGDLAYCLLAQLLWSWSGRYLMLRSNRRIYSEAIHQQLKLLTCKFPGFVFVLRPGKLSVSQPYDQEDEPVAGPEESFDPVLSASAEEKKSVLIQRIEIVAESYDGSQAIDTLTHVDAANTQVAL